MSRRAEISEFVKRAGWGDAHITPLAGDASNRRYDRVLRQDGTTAVLMDAPPSKGEDVRPFVKIATFLTVAGLSAPRIFAQDTARGFLLIEDLGDDLFARVIATDPSLELALYQSAVDVLCHLHQEPPPDLAPYCASVTAPLAALAFDWYLFGATGSVDAAAKTAFGEAFHDLFRPLDAQPQVLIQRDYHAENLLWLPERKGVQKVGLLDFQDAMLGHAGYDLVSILQDARRDVSAELEKQMITRFLAQSTQDPEQFAESYAILGAQRNLRILGVFARLCLRDGKTHYVDLIPRVWEHIQTNLKHPALQDIAKVLNNTLPPPSSEILDKLRSQCATCPDR
ncbi:aminoglycoside phosphotransferase family protein [Roseobacter sp.]|uniref:aminoglycoside phosphotransferase family protein n=1 Tax=Roseobacter sp. TaxID=1907202 RepID=UPI00385C20BD